MRNRLVLGLVAAPIALFALSACNDTSETDDSPSSSMMSPTSSSMTKPTGMMDGSSAMTKPTGMMDGSSAMTKPTAMSPDMSTR